MGSKNRAIASPTSKTFRPIQSLQSNYDSYINLKKGGWVFIPKPGEIICLNP